jgi:hypothetical protein
VSLDRSFVVVSGRRVETDFALAFPSAVSPGLPGVDRSDAQVLADAIVLDPSVVAVEPYGEGTLVFVKDEESLFELGCGLTVGPAVAIAVFEP